MNYNYFLPCFVSAAAILAAGGALAQQCTQAPSCAELGYTDSVSDCADDGILYCPFDKSKVFCRKVDNTGEQCEALGYQLIQKGNSRLFCVEGQMLEYCPADNKYGKCVGEASCFGLGYLPIRNESGIRVLYCAVGQTLEYCPSDNTYGKCVGSSGGGELVIDCEAAGYTKNPTCLSGQTKIYCPADNSYAKCTGGSESCLVGFLNTPETCQRCPNGIKANGYKTSSGQICYSCCSASEICVQCSNSGNFDTIIP